MPPPPDARELTADALASVPVLLEQRGGCARDLFGGGLDADDDGCNTSQEVMSRDAIEIEEQTGCRVVAGSWRSHYDGVVVERSQELEVDHLVSLKEAWDSGAWSWTRDQRSAFSNDLRDGRGLRAVTIASNRSKGDKDPSNWVPSDRRAVCGYPTDWVAVKLRWKLAMDESERGRIANLLESDCQGQRIDPWIVTAVPPAEAPVPPTTLPPTPPPPPPPPPPTPQTTAPPPPPAAPPSPPTSTVPVVRATVRST